VLKTSQQEVFSVMQAAPLPIQAAYGCLPSPGYFFPASGFWCDTRAQAASAPLVSIALLPC
jgi:hypothetical protein